MFTFIRNALALLIGWFVGPSKPVKQKKKTAVSLDLVGFECPLMGEKKLLYGKENLDSVLESISAGSSAPVLNLKL